MEKKKIPALKKLLTPHEWLHIEAFPSMLRILLKDDGLLDAMDAKLDELISLEENSRILNQRILAEIRRNHPHIIPVSGHI